ncbi:hypothetical protein [Jeotgalibacillus marinus]|uniref:Multidrug ABC transporter permease n=1 Tax=Jeotgalibacillus marinus TaxID=86667 RepID=A0ABV3Q744_9BACL
MKSGILSLNKALFQQQLRSISWITIFFTLALIVVLPLAILVKNYPEEYIFQGFHISSGGFNGVFNFYIQFQLVIYTTFPVLLSIILVNYTTKKAATDFMHSLPFTRQTVLNINYLVGALTLLFPLILTAGLMAILRPFLYFPFYSWMEIVEWVAISYFIVLVIFIFTMTIGMFVGNSLLHAGLTYLSIYVPATTVALVLLNMHYYVNGLALFTYTKKLMVNGIFFVRLFVLPDRPFTGFEYVIYTLIAAVLVVISYIAYAKRPSEATDQSIVFPFFRHVFLYGLTFFAMLVAGFFFSEIRQNTLAWTIVGYVLGAFIAYTVLQMILQKTLHLVWPWKGFIAYGVSVALLIIPINIVGGVYAKEVPNVSEVESVELRNLHAGVEWMNAGSMMNDESIEQVINIHQAVVADQDISSRFDGTPIVINYKLKNGNSLIREYSVDRNHLETLTEDLRINEEFKKTYEPIFKIKNHTDLTYVEVPGLNQRVAELDKIEELVKVIKQDVTDVTASPSRFIFVGSEYIGDFYFNFDVEINEPIPVPMYSDYTNTITWLKENGYSEGLTIPENLISIAVLPSMDDEMRGKMGIIYGAEDIPDPKYITTEDEEMMTLYDLSELDSDLLESDYTVLMQFSGETMDYRTYGFNKEDAPDFIKEALPLP